MSGKRATKLCVYYKLGVLYEILKMLETETLPPFFLRSLPFSCMPSSAGRIYGLLIIKGTAID